MRFLLALMSLTLLAIGVSVSAQGSIDPPKNNEDREFGYSLKRFEKSKDKKSQTRATTPSPRPGDEESIRINTELVLMDVLVLDAENVVVGGLQKIDFLVLEDNDSQSVTNFEPNGLSGRPMSIVLILDNMTPQGPTLETSLQAVSGLLRELRPEDEVAVVSIEPKLLQNFTTDRVKIKDALESVAKPSTAVWGGRQFSSLLAVLQEMLPVESKRKPVIILQGLGTEAMWFKPDEEIPYRVSDRSIQLSGISYMSSETNAFLYGFRDIRQAIERAGATIYAVIPTLRIMGKSEEEQRKAARRLLEESITFYKLDREVSRSFLINKYLERELERNLAGQMAMFRVAELSGGNTAFIERPEDAKQVYSEIFRVIEGRYTLGYYPKNERADGRSRSIRVEVRGHPEYQVITRKAYIPVK